MFWMIISGVAATVAGLAVYIYYLQQGQFDDDDEEVKYQIFREHDPDN